MKQFDVYVNPVPRARRAYPFVAVLQADLADSGLDRIVAPLTPSPRILAPTSHLMPRVKVDGVEHAVLVAKLATMQAGDLREHRGQLSGYRDAIVAALDYLFLGV